MKFSEMTAEQRLELRYVNTATGELAEEKDIIQ